MIPKLSGTPFNYSQDGQNGVEQAGFPSQSIEIREHIQM
jgi:hypothetical protein